MDKVLLYILLAKSVQYYFTRLGYFGVYAWFITVDQIVPVPEEITLIIIGYFVSLGFINPFLAGAAAIAAFITVDTVYFFLTKSGNKLAHKITHRPQNPKTNKYKERLKNHTFKTLLILSFIPRMRLLGPVFVSLLKIPYRRFLLYDAISLCAFTAVYISLGFIFHRSLSSIITDTKSLIHIIFISAMVLMTILTIVIIRKMR